MSTINEVVEKWAKSCVEVQLGWRAINAFPLNPPRPIAVFVVKVYENRI
jgi:hypothetical protein